MCPSSKGPPRNEHDRLSAAARRADEAMALGDEAGEADSDVDD